MLASGWSDGLIRLWHFVDGIGLRKNALAGHGGAVHHLSFSGDGRLLASCSWDKTVRLWRCDTHENVLILPVMTSNIYEEYARFGTFPAPPALAFNPRTPVLATIGEESGEIRIWELDLESIFEGEVPQSVKRGNSTHGWDVFISHASEDKDSVARPLAELLKHAGLEVWFDEFALKLGDNLRRSIDHGLTHSRYGVVVLSPAFFAKEWPQKELDGLVARESGRRKVVLPVWHNVTREDVERFSPILAGRVAVSTSDGLDAVVRSVVSVLSPRASRSEDPTDTSIGRPHDEVRKSVQEFNAAFAKAGFCNMINAFRHLDLRVINLLKFTADTYGHLLHEDLRAVQALEDETADTLAFKCTQMLAKGYMLDRFFATRSLFSEELPEATPEYEELARRWRDEVLTNPSWEDHWLDDFVTSAIEELTQAAITLRLGEIPPDDKPHQQFLCLMKTCIAQGVVVRRFITSGLKA
jgi:hypothetical protein